MPVIAPTLKIVQFEEALARLPQLAARTDHDFCDGVYARSLHIPAGAALTGAIHRTENLFVVRTGDITVWTDEGMKRLTAGAMGKSLPGIKRVGYAHANTIFTTFHANPDNVYDPELIWEMYTVESVHELDFKVMLEIEA